MKDLTILISACSSPSIPGILACFRNNGERFIRIVGVDMNDEPSVNYLVDKFYRVPSVSASNYCDIILDICKKEHVDIYMPGISLEVSVAVNKKEEFDKLGVILSMSNQDSVEISNNKLHTYELLQSAKIKVPKFYGVHSVDDFIIGCQIMGYPEKPICLKIVDGSGARGVRIIDAKKSRYDIFAHEKPNSFYTSYDDMISILNEPKYIDEMMLVEYMPGNEYTVDLLADRGKVLYEVGRDNIVSLMSIAQESILLYNADAYKIAEDVVDLLKLDGNVGIDFMKDANGIPILMDINPRITATISVIAAGGVNLPYLRIKQLLGEPLPNCKPQYGTRIRRRYLETFTDVNDNLIEFNYK